ncbi:shikimate kinase [Methanococcoides vulcani]|uniref:Shikimate kinase n=1 Tax=Methanococcoides vulcani TaxID=1353158 RepID=A0A1I0BQU9_9EURY|nr:shikimate kinase [Methanococcoides vulcani]SET09012.1 shikimate kinase [Methanococcoides vulcani]
MRKNMNITLIGMSGVGKTTIGKLLSKKLGYGFVDVDDLIKKRIGTSLQSFIDNSGDAAFLELEEQVVLDLEPLESCIIATGGSMIYSEVAMEHLRSISTVVYLDAPFGRIARRIEPSKRGVVGLKEKSLKELYHERKVLYEKYLDVHIKIEKGERKSAIADRIIAICFEINGS